jgi:DNA polymerase-3 subunit beta
VFSYGVGASALTSCSFFKARQRAGSRRVSLLASEKSNSVKLIFSKSNIDIVANTPEVGEAKESLPVMYKGREFSIAFNPEFLMAPLRNLSEDEIYLDLIDEMSPGVIKIAGPFLCVLMPMRF